MRRLRGMEGGEPDPQIGRRSFDSLAAALFAALVILGVIGAVVGFAASSDPPWIVRLVAVAGVLLGVAALLVAMWGLSDGRSWAVRAATTILWLLVAEGAVRLVVALGSSTLHIPLGAIVAVIILRRRRRQPRPIEPLAAIVAGAYALSLVWPIVTRGVFTPGATPLAVGGDALELTLDLECLPPGKAPPLAGVAVATWAFVADVGWRWLRRDAFPDSTDGLVVTWTAAAEEDGGYYIERTDYAQAAGVWLGDGSPATTLIRPLAQRAPSTTFGIDVRQFGHQDGSVRLVLRPSVSDQPFGRLSVGAAYAHLDRWLLRADARECDWGSQPG